MKLTAEEVKGQFDAAKTIEVHEDHSGMRLNSGDTFEGFIVASGSIFVSCGRILARTCGASIVPIQIELEGESSKDQIRHDPLHAARMGVAYMLANGQIDSDRIVELNNGGSCP